MRFTISEVTIFGIPIQHQISNAKPIYKVSARYLTSFLSPVTSAEQPICEYMQCVFM